MISKLRSYVDKFIQFGTKHDWVSILLVLLLFPFVQDFLFEIIYKQNGREFTIQHWNWFLGKLRFLQMSDSLSFDYDGVLFFSILKNYFSLIILLFLTLPLIIFFKRLKWEHWEWAKYLKLFLFTIAIIWTWYFATQEYNYFHDNYFIIDRLLMLAFAVLILYHPMFVSLFVVHSFVYMTQYYAPVDWFLITDKRIIIEILSLFPLFCFARILFKTPSYVFFFIAITAHMAGYYIPGVGKMMLGPHWYSWMMNEDLTYMMLNNADKGWLESIPGLMDFLTGSLQYLNLAFVIMALIIEMYSMFIFLNRRAAVWAFASFNVLHILIFIFAGIFFWKWILLNFLIIYLLIKMPEVELKKLFNRKYFIYGIVVLLFSGVIYRPPALSWYAISYLRYFSYEVVDEDGQSHCLNANELHPYQMYFVFQKFHQILDMKMMGASVATEDLTFKEEVDRVGKDKILDFVEERGTYYYQPEQDKKVTHFVRTYFQNRNRYEEKKKHLKWMQAPMHIYTFPRREECFDFDKKIVKLKIFMHERYHQDEKMHNLQDKLIKEIDIY